MQTMSDIALLEGEEGERMASREAFYRSPHLSLKWSSYFEVYDELFRPYQGKPITFVEIGVLNGGSLFMWRQFFGQDARIIGVELNPGAQRWREHGFEIFTGSQSDPEFWARFIEEVGDIDILLDDGGHTFDQQIITADCMLPAIRDGGLLVVEDTHTSYMQEFGGPSRRSFVSYAKNIVDGVNFRSPETGGRPNRTVCKVSFFESMVAFHIDRRSAREESEHLANCNAPLDAEDFRYKGSVLGAVAPLAKRLVHATPALKRPVRMIQGWIAQVKSRKLARYFRH